MKKYVKYRISAWFYWRGVRKEMWEVVGVERVKEVIRKLRKRDFSVSVFWSNFGEEFKTTAGWKGIRVKVVEEWSEIAFEKSERKQTIISQKATRWIEMAPWGVKYKCRKE